MQSLIHIIDHSCKRLNVYFHVLAQRLQARFMHFIFNKTANFIHTYKHNTQKTLRNYNSILYN